LKRLNFSPRSEIALEDIGEWSTENFGLVRAQRYSGDLLAVCRRIALEEAHWQSCREVFAPHLRSELRFARSGRHFIIFIETATEFVIIDFIHQSADLGGRLGGPDE
jgi:toxin ParE1/3/4